MVTTNATGSAVVAGAAIHHTTKTFGTATSFQDEDMKLAWAIINDEASWKDSTEKDQILKKQLGIKGYEDLKYMQDKDIQSVMEKLLTIPARRLGSVWRTTSAY
jgi:hypothetical protein